MEQSRPRVSQIERNKQFIVKSKRHLGRDLSVILFSMIVWIYVIIVLYFFLDVILGLDHQIPMFFKSLFKTTNDDVRWFLVMVLLGFGVIYVLLFGWSKYNKLKYGPLRRRTYPKDANDTDLINLGMIDYDLFIQLQNTKDITLEKNPMK
jgi:hypothetical protein